MVVVVTLANCPENHKEIFSWVDVPVVGFVAKQMGHAVDAPGEVEGKGVSEYGTGEEGSPGTLAPEVPGHNGGHDEAEEYHGRYVDLSLDGADWVGQQVTDINALAFLANLWVFPHKQPAHVGKEEPSLGIVGVCIGFRELVVRTMITGPLNDVILEGHAVEDSKKDTQW